MVKVIRTSATKEGDIVNQAFSVNKNKVVMALQFLKNHNILYNDIIINTDNFSWMDNKEECDLQSVITMESTETEAEDTDR
jgi:hypothetical protein